MLALPLERFIVFLKGVTSLLIHERSTKKSFLRVDFYVCFSWYAHAVITACRQQPVSSRVCGGGDALQSGLSSHTGM